MSDDPASAAERAVEAQAQARIDRQQQAREMAVNYFTYLAAQFGDETARDAWKLAPPKRRRGYRVTDEKARSDRLAVLSDETHRELGLSAEASAELIGEQLGIGEDSHDTRRTLDRIIVRQRGKSIPE